VIPTSAPTPVPTPSSSPIPTPPVATGPTTLGSTVTFHGRGYGHGVGLSQYGARGRANDGQSAAAILAHYYEGTTLGSIPLDTPIRVRVLGGFAASASKPLVVVGRRGAWRIDGGATLFPDGARLEARPTLSKETSGPTYVWRVKVIDTAGAILRDTPGPSSLRLRGSTAATVFQVASRTSSHDLYRGTIRVGLNTSTGHGSATDELPMEHYLRGVVPAEMPSTWATAALEAQSIAARSYAGRRLRPGVSYFDVEDDTSSQVFLGLLGEKATTTAAIGATAGVVLKSGTEIANAMFHSTGGGATEHNENVYVSATGAKVAGPVSYLRGARDRRANGSAFDDSSPYATWRTATYTRTQLSSWFGADSRTNVGSLTALDLRVRGVSGRLIQVRLIGSLGSKTVSGDVFRSVFNARRPTGDPMLRSTLFDTKPVP
ncbi:MAG: SpoIID/LytB domain-containing protein, partial [Candidatus Limnocylindrales bacterium]